MNLTMEQLCRLTGLKEKSVLKWIQEKDMPCFTSGAEILFNKVEAGYWFRKNNIQVARDFFMEISACSKKRRNLYELISAGGIHKDIAASCPEEAISGAVYAMEIIPPEIPKEILLHSLLEREKMMPTAMGKGIAIPHPHKLIISQESFEQVSVFYLKDPVDFKASDAGAVHTLFMLLSATPANHLCHIAAISRLAQREDFIKLLKDKVSKEILLDYIKRCDGAF